MTRSTSVGTGMTVSAGKNINGRLDLAVTPNLVINGVDRNLVETTPSNGQVTVKNIDLTGAGAGTLFGLAVVPSGVYFINESNNALRLPNSED